MSRRLRYVHWIALVLLMSAPWSLAAQDRADAGARNSLPVLAFFVKIPVAGMALPAYLAKPANGSAWPAVLLVSPDGNLAGEVRQTARDVAAHGFVALALNYDPNRVSQESTLVQSVAEDQLAARLSAGLDWLARQRPLADPQRIGALGWGGGATRVLKLAQQGRVRTGVVIADQPCSAAQNFSGASGARILTIVGGCTAERGQELQREIAAAGTAGQVRTFQTRLETFPQPANQQTAPVWSEIYKFLSDIAADPNIPQQNSSAPPTWISTIRDIMRVINSDDGVRGKLALLLTPSSSGQVQWDMARSNAAVLVDACEWLLALRPPKGTVSSWRGHVADYKSATQTLFQAVEQHNLAGAQQAFARLPQSCAACHLDHR